MPEPLIEISERDYILVQDLTHLRDIQSILRDIIPASNPLIEQEDFTAVYRQVNDWVDAHFAILKTHE